MTEPLTLAQRLRDHTEPRNIDGYSCRRTPPICNEAADELDRITEANKALTAKAEAALADWSKAATSGIEDFKRAEAAEADNARLTKERDKERKHVARLMRDLDYNRKRAEAAEARIRTMEVKP